MSLLSPSVLLLSPCESPRTQTAHGNKSERKQILLSYVVAAVPASVGPPARPAIAARMSTPPSFYPAEGMTRAQLRRLTAEQMDEIALDPTLQLWFDELKDQSLASRCEELLRYLRLE
jgi:hypothetical protein